MSLRELGRVACEYVRGMHLMEGSEPPLGDQRKQALMELIETGDIEGAIGRLRSEGWGGKG